MSAGSALQSMAARPQRSMAHWAAVLVVAVGALAVSTVSGSAAETLASGAAAYKPYAVEHIGQALVAAKQMQAAIKAGDAKAAQAAWIKSRAGWESVEPITGEFFRDLDEAIDAWPDSKQGYHAIEAPLFAGKLDTLAAPADKVVADLASFDKKLKAKGFKFAPQGLLNGATKLAYEVGENKSKGGESPYAGTSINDMRDNVEGIEAVYKVVFDPVLKKRDGKLAHRIHEKIEDLEKILGAKDIKSLDQPALSKAGEELAVLLQMSAAKFKLKKPTVGGE
jgi:iron uptake system EfeUOB component EfeO/EfeM